MEGLLGGHEAGTGRVEMDVVASGAQILRATFVDALRFEAPTEKMAPRLPAAVPTLGVGAEQPFHAEAEIRLRSFQDEVKMVAHEDVDVNLPAGFRASLAEPIKERVPVAIVEKDHLATIPATHHMVNRARIFNPQRARHAGAYPAKETSVNSKN